MYDLPLAGRRKRECGLRGSHPCGAPGGATSGSADCRETVCIIQRFATAVRFVVHESWHLVNGKTICLQSAVWCICIYSLWVYQIYIRLYSSIFLHINQRTGLNIPHLSPPYLFYQLLPQRAPWDICGFEPFADTRRRPEFLSTAKVWSALPHARGVCVILVRRCTQSVKIYIRIYLHIHIFPRFNWLS